MTKKHIATYTTHMLIIRKNFLKHIPEPVLLLSWHRSKTGLVSTCLENGEAAFSARDMASRTVELKTQSRKLKPVSVGATSGPTTTTSKFLNSSEILE